MPLLQNTTQVASRENIYLKYYSNVKVLKGTAEEMGLVINDLETKGYETLIFKQLEKVWEKARENLFLSLYRYHIFKQKLETDYQTQTHSN